MSYPALKVANYFLSKANGKLSNLQIQKLVYIAHGWTLAITGEPLINDSIEAWPLGPVVPNLYHVYKRHGRGWIGGFNPKQLKGFDEIHLAIMDRVWEEYGEYGGIQLSELTHQEGTPWATAIADKLGIIPRNIIQDYYKAMLL